MDVFFVISGYLATGHLVREVASRGRVDLPGLYARRARRLLPAASLTRVAVGAATYMWIPRWTWETVAADMAASTVYAENWVLVTWTVADAIARMASSNDRLRIVLLLSSRGS